MAELNLVVFDAQRNIKVGMVPVDLIDPNEWNPNKMDAVNFARLAEDMATIGYLQPVFLVPVDGGRFRIVDGEHRWEAAKLSDMEEILAIVYDNADFITDEDRQKFQTLRLNRIRGKLDKKKFEELVREMSERYSIDELADGFAFDDKGDLEGLLRDTRSSLPNDEMRREFDKCRAEVKTVDDLGLVLNRLFTKFGSTLDFHYMILDFGGVDHVWIRFPGKREFRAFSDRAALCREMGVTMDSVFLHLMDGLTREFIEQNYDSLEEVREEEYADELGIG